VISNCKFNSQLTVNSLLGDEKLFTHRQNAQTERRPVGSVCLSPNKTLKNDNYFAESSDPTKGALRQPSELGPIGERTVKHRILVVLRINEEELELQFASTLFFYFARK
jgi:hypothetical protein